jgi:hypothetical protein
VEKLEDCSHPVKAYVAFYLRSGGQEKPSGCGFVGRQMDAIDTKARKNGDHGRQSALWLDAVKSERHGTNPITVTSDIEAKAEPT